MRRGKGRFVRLGGAVPLLCARRVGAAAGEARRVPRYALQVPGLAVHEALGLSRIEQALSLIHQPHVALARAGDERAALPAADGADSLRPGEPFAQGAGLPPQRSRTARAWGSWAGAQGDAMVAGARRMNRRRETRAGGSSFRYLTLNILARQPFGSASPLPGRWSTHQTRTKPSAPPCAGVARERGGSAAAALRRSSALGRRFGGGGTGRGPGRAR